MTEELEVLADLARRSARVEADPHPEAELRRLGQAWRRRQRKRTWAGVSVGLLAASAAAILFYSGRERAPLTYAVEGDVAWTDRHIDVRGGAARMSFSDGTRFELSRATRAELTSLDDRGARVRLQAGRTHADVVHKPRARWAVEAGPFTVHVIGTVFDVTWSAPEQVLEVALSEGEVRVEGPHAQLPLSVRAGQRLMVRARDGQLRIAPLAARMEAPVEAPKPVVAAVVSAPIAVAGDFKGRDTPLPTSPRGGPRVEETGPRPTSRRAVVFENSVSSARGAGGGRAGGVPPIDLLHPRSAAGGGRVGGVPPSEIPPAPVTPPPSTAPTPPLALPIEPSARFEPVLPAVPETRPWAARVAASEFRPVLDEAIAEGLDNSYQRRPSDDLAGLSDAARYLGRRDVARDALLAQRRRFTGSEHARRAAFRLGALAEEAGAGAEAVDWYDAYLTESPSGIYVPEALGRKMLAIERRDGAAAARALAGEYRRRFAQGSYLVHALRILQAR